MRKLRSIDFDNFGSDVTNSSLPSLFAMQLPCLHDLIIQYNDFRSFILGIHNPLKTKTVNLRPAAPWYSEEINNSKKYPRRLERRWQRTKLPIYRQFINAVPSTTYLSRKLITLHSVLINDNQSDYKLIIDCIESVIHHIRPAPRLWSSQISLSRYFLIR